MHCDVVVAGFSYDKAELKQGEAKAEMAPLLEELAGMLKSDTAFSEDGHLGMDDAVVLPELRTLSCAKGVAWPEKLKTYVTGAFQKAGVATYFS